MDEPVVTEMPPEDPPVAEPVETTTSPPNAELDVVLAVAISTFPLTPLLLWPDMMDTLPPVADCDAPADRTMAPPSLFCETPLAIVMSPELPLESPDESAIDPLEPLSLLPVVVSISPVFPVCVFADFIITAPLEPDSLAPETTMTLPPLSDALPASNVKSPAVPWDCPTRRAILPVVPAPSPVFSWISPLV